MIIWLDKFFSLSIQLHRRREKGSVQEAAQGYRKFPFYMLGFWHLLYLHNRKGGFFRQSIVQLSETKKRYWYIIASIFLQIRKKSLVFYEKIFELNSPTSQHLSFIISNDSPRQFLDPQTRSPMQSSSDSQLPSPMSHPVSLEYWILLQQKSPEYSPPSHRSPN